MQEEEYGRARVKTQWGDEAEYLSEAIDLCPVDCISYVPRDQLALLEFVMKGCKREDAAILARRCALAIPMAKCMIGMCTRRDCVCRVMF